MIPIVINQSFRQISVLRFKKYKFFNDWSKAVNIELVQCKILNKKIEIVEIQIKIFS